MDSANLIIGAAGVALTALAAFGGLAGWLITRLMHVARHLTTLIESIRKELMKISTALQIEEEKRRSLERETDRRITRLEDVISRSALGALVLVLGLAVGTMACTGTTALEALVDAAIAATPAIEAAAGVSPALQGEVAQYLSLAQSCASESVTALQDNTLSLAEQGAGITAQCANIAAPALPGGTPAAVATAISAVASALEGYLRTVTAAKSELRLSRPWLANSFAGHQPAAKKIDRKALARVAKKLQKLKAALAAKNAKVAR